MATGGHSSSDASENSCALQPVGVYLLVCAGPGCGKSSTTYFCLLIRRMPGAHTTNPDARSSYNEPFQ